MDWSGAEVVCSGLCQAQVHPIRVLDNLVVMPDSQDIVGCIIARTGVLPTTRSAVDAQFVRWLGLACGRVDGSRVLKHLLRSVVSQFIVEAVTSYGKGS